MLLLRICWHWRTVALDSALLWRRINLCLPGALDEFKCQILVDILKRAKEAPLSLRLMSSEGPYSHVGTLGSVAQPTSNLVNQLLRPITTSLVRLVLQNISTTEIHAVPPGLLPCLERLVLQFNLGDIQNFPWKTAGRIKAFSRCWRLRRVALINGSIDVDERPSLSGLHNIRLPLERLTHFFEVSSPGFPASHFLLRYSHRCKMLQHLYLEMRYPDDIGDLSYDDWRWDKSPVLTFEALESLTLSFHGNAVDDIDIGYPTFFDKIRFPKLKHLRLDGGDLWFEDYSLWTPIHLESFLTILEGLSHLRTLALCISWTKVETLQQLFRTTPHVSTLDVSLHSELETLFEALTPSDSKQPLLLPKLRALRFAVGNVEITVDEEDGFKGFEVEEFSRFLDYRMRVPETKLHSISLYTTEGDESNVADKTPFVEVVGRYVGAGLVLETSVMPRQRHQAWLKRDPMLANWSEAIAFMD